jgi:hypothetical protein
MDAPMSNWFCSIPHAYDGIAAAAKVYSYFPLALNSQALPQFQQETLASSVRFYKKKCSERGALINRLKGEAAENKLLKKSPMPSL